MCVFVPFLFSERSKFTMPLTAHQLPSTIQRQVQKYSSKHHVLCSVADAVVSLRAALLLEVRLLEPESNEPESVLEESASLVVAVDVPDPTLESLRPAAGAQAREL
jgi:hypothetical protein